MWSDNETNDDLLGFNHLISAVKDILSHPSLLPTTVGIFGDWGSGKSSLIQMLQKEMESDAETCVVSFNGWLFEGYEDARTAIMATVLEELKNKKKASEVAKDLFSSLVKRVNWLSLAGKTVRHGTAFATLGPMGLGFSALTDGGNVTDIFNRIKNIKEDELKDLIESETPIVRQGIRDFRRDFASLLEKTKVTRLLVVVDDLDRCLPPTVIETLEAIKLFLFVPGTAFVIAADERLIKYAVQQRFPQLPGERAEVGRDYLEKLIQFPIRIPPLGPSETETYIALLFLGIANKPTELEKVREPPLPI